MGELPADGLCTVDHHLRGKKGPPMGAYSRSAVRGDPGQASLLNNKRGEITREKTIARVGLGGR